MKILMVLENYFDGDTRVENEALSLISNGHEVSIICYSKINRSLIDEYNGITLYRVAIPELIKKSSVAALKFPFYFNFWRREINKVMSSRVFNAIHVHDLPLVKVCYEISMDKGLKLVVDLHENFPALLNISEHTNTPLGKLLCSVKQWEAYEKKYVNLLDNIIVVIEEARERLIKLGVNREKIKVVSNHLKIDSFRGLSKNPKDSGKLVFVYLGGATFHRGLQYVLEAANYLKNYSDKFSVRIIGDGRFMPALKRMVKSLSLSNIEFTGWLTDKESFKELAQGDIAIIPHIKSDHTDNTIPHKLFFYMYYGFPVISSDCIPIKRILEEANAGITFPSGDSEKLAEIMGSFIINPSKITDYSPSTKAVEQKYNWEMEARTLVSLYKQFNN